LFNLEVDIGGGRVGRITVHDGEDTNALAQKFVQEHNLPAAAVPRLQMLLEQNMQMHKSGSSKKNTSSKGASTSTRQFR
jgi:hypothetical protein